MPQPASSRYLKLLTLAGESLDLLDDPPLPLVGGVEPGVEVLPQPPRQELPPMGRLESVKN